jgi:hypothetical protein
VDGGDSAAFSGFFYTRTESCSRSFIYSRPTATNANRLGGFQEEVTNPDKVGSMTEIDEQLAVLKLFNEKVEELLELSFVKAVTAPNAGFSLSGKLLENGKFEINTEVRGPSDEAIKAFVLTFRFFIQDNETISLRNIAKLYEESNIDSTQKDYLDAARDAINKMLDTPNFINLTYNGKTPTNREVMEVFIYGGLAHATPEKYQLYKEWMSFPPVAAALQTCFTMILGRILQILVNIEEINKMTIALLSEQRS